PNRVVVTEDRRARGVFDFSAFGDVVRRGARVAAEHRAATADGIALRHWRQRRLLLALRSAAERRPAAGEQGASEGPQQTHSGVLTRRAGGAAAPLEGDARGERRRKQVVSTAVAAERQIIARLDVEAEPAILVQLDTERRADERLIVGVEAGVTDAPA